MGFNNLDKPIDIQNTFPCFSRINGPKKGLKEIRGFYDALSNGVIKIHISIHKFKKYVVLTLIII